MVHLYDLDLSAVRPSLDLGLIEITEDADVRSPRTPIYQPTSPFFSSLSPFDPAKLFPSSSAPLTPKEVAPTKKTLPPPPSDPLAWVWQCHLCRSRWPLGVTRRCLLDGHFYCSGETSQPNLKKKKKGQSCGSEFDYVGWKERGEWKRNALLTMSNARMPTGCERCEFPSQCRYGPKEKGRIENQPSMVGIEYTFTTAEDEVARYYSKDKFTFESTLAKMEAAGTSVQSRMADLYEADKPLKGSKSVDGESGVKVAMTAQRRPVKKPSLSPIEEEAVRGEKGLGFQDLIMPLVDFVAHSKEKRRSLL